MTQRRFTQSIRGDRRAVAVLRIALAAVLIISWELGGRLSGESAWVSSPSLIARRIGEWLGEGLWADFATTTGEMVIGVALGAPLGVLLGLLLGRSPRLAALLRPLVVALYSVPLITLAPLLILWFGLDMMPKIVLVSAVTFFLMFFTTFSGAKSIDGELVQSLQLMGATRREVFRKLVAPASVAWISSGLKIALPYALIAATVGEMLAARRGLGYLLSQSAAQVDLTGVYAALAILMLLGVLTGEGAARLERRLLRWRGASAQGHGR